MRTTRTIWNPVLDALPFESDSDDDDGDDTSDDDDGAKSGGEDVKVSANKFSALELLED